MKIKLGIFGGGQLGMYLCEAARRLGIESSVLTEHSDSPAVAQADRVFIGPMDDLQLVEKFLQSCDIVTFEKEDIPNETLAFIATAERDGSIQANPSAQAMFMLKDKGLQRNWLRLQGFPQLPYKLIPGAGVNQQELVENFGLPLVQKTRCGGYDGLGVQILEDEAALEGLWNTPSLVERFLGDCSELAVIIARGLDGGTHSYPPMGMRFDTKLNALSMVCTPAPVNATIAKRAIHIAEEIVARLNEVGVFAVEFFLTPDDKLFINEISPRVHNSGHLTLDACTVSQFEQHVRAVIGLPLAEVAALRPAAMVNVLYAQPLESSCPARPVSYLSDEGHISVHWYGKPPGRHGRKMGHITALAGTAEMAGELAQRALANLARPSKHEAA